jgi:hypothetical protein
MNRVMNLENYFILVVIGIILGANERQELTSRDDLNGCLQIALGYPTETVTTGMAWANIASLMYFRAFAVIYTWRGESFFLYFAFHE